MRFLSGIILFFILVSFSGAPQLLSALLREDSAVTALNDFTEEKEKEDGKKEKEEDNAKEALLIDFQLAFLRYSASFETHSGVLHHSGYYPEDHSPPPELI